MKGAGLHPAYMLDQSHNVTDPIESLMMSAVEVERAYVRPTWVNRDPLTEAQELCDPLMALAILKTAFTTCRRFSPLARAARGGSIIPLRPYRASGYRRRKSESVGNQRAAASGIV